MSFSSFSIGLVETAFNAALNQDPTAKKALAELGGSIIAFDISDIGLKLYFVPGIEKTLVLNNTEDQPDCTFSGPITGFLAMLGSENKSDAVLNKQVTIRGNTGLAHRFGDILGALDIDWEEQLSHITGDIPAHLAGNMVKGISAYAKDLLSNSQQDIEEYLVEELRTNPHRLEIQSYIEGVDTIRDDVERLEQRIIQLRKQQA